MSQEDEILLERVKNLHNLSGQDKFYLHQTVKDDADLLSKLNLRRISTKAKSIPVASKRDSMDTRHFSNCLTLIMRSMLELTPCITPFWVCQRGVLRDPSSFDKIPNQGKWKEGWLKYNSFILSASLTDNQRSQHLIMPWGELRSRPIKTKLQRVSNLLKISHVFKYCTLPWWGSDLHFRKWTSLKKRLRFLRKPGILDWIFYPLRFHPNTSQPWRKTIGLMQPKFGGTSKEIKVLSFSFQRAGFAQNNIKSKT